MVTDFELGSNLILTNMTMKPIWGTFSVGEVNQKRKVQ